MSTINRTDIEWTDFSVNPFKLQLRDGRRINACVKISEGCRNCYAEGLGRRWWPKAERTAGRDFPGYSLPLLQSGAPWLDVALLRGLLRWKPKPPFKSPDGRPKVFAFDMTDFFLDLWPDEFLDAFMAVVAIRQDIDFQILTKRPERMREYLGRPDAGRKSGDAAKVAISSIVATFRSDWDSPIVQSGKGLVGIQTGTTKATSVQWPLPNLWLGVSAENQKYADERIPILRQTPAAIRFISYEPAIGPIFSRHITAPRVSDPSDRIDWIIVGGESGPNARPFNHAWAMNMIIQCRITGIPCFVKQLGTLQIYGDHKEPVRHIDIGEPRYWPEELRVRQWPTATRGSYGS